MVFLQAVPAWETYALWQFLVALRSARDGEPDATALGELLREAGEYRHPPRSGPQPTSSPAQRVLSVLPLDIPAVRTLATALALNTPQDTHLQTAHGQIRTARRTAGIR